MKSKKTFDVERLLSFAVAGALILISALVFPDPASATCTNGIQKTDGDNVKVCVNYGISYNDVGGGEDNWTSNSAVVARGIRVRVFKTGDDAFGGSTGAYVDKDTGCTPTFNVSGAANYTVRVYSDAQLTSGNDLVKVFADSTHKYYYDVTTTFEPTDNLTCTYTWNNSSGGVIESGGSGSTADVVDIAAAAGFAVSQNNGGLSSKTLSVFNSECAGGGSCTVEDSSSNTKIYFSTFGRERKFDVAHEVGHAIQFLLDGGSAPVQTPSNPPSSGACDRDGNPNHTLVSKESQGMASTEGFAHFWSAATWNAASSANCMFGYYKDVDLDQSGGDPDCDVDPLYNECDPWVSCVDNASSLTYPDYDYLHGMCSSTYAGQATEYDWMRGLFHIYSAAEPVTPTQLGNIWGAADPHNWDADETAGDADSPFTRLDDAADVLDLDEEGWWAWFTSMNGVYE